MAVLAGLPPSTAYAAGTWKKQTSGTAFGLASVAFPDATHGWAVGSGIMLVTTDGGASWTTKTNSRGGNSVTFIDATHGWLAVQNTNILATVDGGTTWTSPSVGGSGGYGLGAPVTFVDAMHGWAVGQQGHPCDHRRRRHMDSSIHRQWGRHPQLDLIC